MDGNIHILGTSNKPDLSGAFNFDSASVYVGALASSIRLDSSTIRIADNRILFNRYKLYSAGDNPFVLDGNVDFSDMARMTADLRMFANNMPFVQGTTKEVKGIKGLIDITWTFVENDEGTWVSAFVQERGKTASEGGYQFDYKLPETVNTVDELRLNAWDADNATTVDNASITGEDKIVVYQDAATAPKRVASVEVVKTDKIDGDADDIIYRYGMPVVATQPVVGENYYVNSITLDDGTVIKGADVGKYVTVTWVAEKSNGATVPTKYDGSDANRVSRSFTVDKDKTGKFNGCFIYAVASANKDAGIFGEATWGADADSLAVQQRIAGENRYETALAVADQMKPADGFKNFFVATGTNYADALSATALANKMGAPILLVNGQTGAYEEEVAAYIEANAANYSRTKVYVLGGTSAVSADFDQMLYKFGVEVERFAGDTRYDTNIEVLDEYFTLNPIAEYGAGDAEILVTSGQNYPDALSASATGKPVLLVGDELTAEQKDYLETLAPVTEGKKGATSITYHVDKFTIIGGTSAVNSDVKAELSRPAYIKSADSVTRLWGDDRYETNRAVVNKYNTDKTIDKYAFVAYGMDYADALTGGVLAAKEGCSLILVDDNHTGIASYIISTIAKNNANYGGIVVIGGENAVSNATVQKIA